MICNKEDVYKKVKQIPKGYFSTYKIIAEELGSPNGSRAVGKGLRAHGCIIDDRSGNDVIECKEVHCYRVIKSDFSIGGYVFNRIKKNQKKKELLEKEGIRFDERGYVKKEDRKLLFTFHKGKCGCEKCMLI